MFSVCFSSFIFIIISSFSGMPISGTHTVVGALMGAGTYAQGFRQLNWPKMGVIVVSWFVSPTMAGLISFTLMMVISGLLMRTDSVRFSTRLLYLQLLTGFTVTIIVFILYYLLAAEHLINRDTTSLTLLILLVFIGGTVFSRVSLFFTLKANCNVALSFREANKLFFKSLLLPLSFEFYEIMAFHLKLEGDQENLMTLEAA